MSAEFSRNQTPQGRCPGPLSRRTWLTVGGLSFASLFTGRLPSLPELLAGEENDEFRAANDDFSVILFWANGGPSHLDMFDLKPQAPVEYRGPFRPIQTNVPGVEIADTLPNLARMADKFAIVRSLHHTRSEHSGGTNRMVTGYESVAANPIDSEFPEVGAVVARHVAHQTKDLPLYVANTRIYGGGPAYLGPAYNAYMPNANPVTASGANQYDPVPIYTTGSENGTLSISQQAASRLRRRAELLRSFDTLRRDTDRTGRMDAVDRFNQQAVEMLASARTRDAFDISQESEATRALYGETHWGRSLLTCRRLVESGVRFVQCQATFRLKPETGRTTTWDDHSVNADIFKAYEEKLPVFDQAVPALISDLYDRGLDRKVLFVFCGEFGRTPKIANQDKSGRPGRDHWPRAMSVLLAGGGLKTGQAVGATSARAEDPVDRIMDSNCLLATIYQRFGIDYHRAFLDNTGRPIPILTDGHPIEELL